MWKLGHLLIQYVFAEIYLYKELIIFVVLEGDAHRMFSFTCSWMWASLPFTLRIFYTSQNSFLAYVVYWLTMSLSLTSCDTKCVARSLHCCNPVEPNSALVPICVKNLSSLTECLHTPMEISRTRVQKPWFPDSTNQRHLLLTLQEFHMCWHRVSQAPWTHLSCRRACF